MSVFTCGRRPIHALYCGTCQVANWFYVTAIAGGCSHRLRLLKVGDRIKASGMQVDDGTMGTVDFVEPGRYGVTWDEER